jgi:hypothetical protein
MTRLSQRRTEITRYLPLALKKGSDEGRAQAALLPTGQ